MADGSAQASSSLVSLLDLGRAQFVHSILQ